MEDSLRALLCARLEKVKRAANPFSKLLAVALCLGGKGGTGGPDSDNLTSL